MININLRIIMLSILSLVLSAIFIISGCGIKDTEKIIGDKIIVKINGVQITLKDYGDWLITHGIKRGDKSFSRSEIIDSLIERQLILQEGKRLGITLSDDEVDRYIRWKLNNGAGDYDINGYTNFVGYYTYWRNCVKEEILEGKIIRTVFESQIKVSDEEISEYYKKNINKYKREKQVRARQIVVKSLKKASEIKKMLDSGKSFGKLARRYSLTPDRKIGGDLGFFSSDEMPKEFVKATFPLKIGQISDIVKTVYGFHIFKVTDKRRGGTMPLSEVKEIIREILWTKKREDMYKVWISGLRMQAKVKINEKFLLKKTK